MDEEEVAYIIREARRLTGDTKAVEQANQSADFNEGYIVTLSECVVALADRLGL